MTILSCSDSIEDIASCENNSTILSTFQTQEGDNIVIYEDGSFYQVGNNCNYIGQYFSPDFFDTFYETSGDGILLKVDDSTFYKPQATFFEDFENAVSFSDLFVSNADDRSRLFTQFTVQSPASPTVREYNALGACILDRTCDFIDNTISLAPDPTNPVNQVLKFYAVKPDPDMVTSKASIASSTVFFKSGDAIWFEAEYYVEGNNTPSTLVDFESSHFYGSPGPRIILSDMNIALENKFGAKSKYTQTTNPYKQFPLNEWVTIKVHLLYHEKEGIIQVWQDNQLIIDRIGRNIPLSIWVQSILEIGISATQDETTLYVDNVRFSDIAF